jgi:hypothetical protein
MLKLKIRLKWYLLLVIHWILLTIILLLVLHRHLLHIHRILHFIICWLGHHIIIRSWQWHRSYLEILIVLTGAAIAIATLGA